MSVRIYNRRNWRDRLQPLKLAEQPLCELCLKVGRITRATTVHHLVDIAAGGAPYPELSELQSLCTSCHSMVTRARQCGVNYVAKGCDAHGLPLDPRHPFYRR
jgi:5-methylcytosine-specific restriction endonuclease McrA